MLLANNYEHVDVIEIKDQTTTAMYHFFILENYKQDIKLNVMLRSACIGFCRNNEKQELGVAINNYLKKRISEDELLSVCKNIRISNWKVQKKHNIDIIPSNDFSMYDNVLDMTCLVGNIQRRFYWEGGRVPLHIYFTMAHGQQKDKFDIFPLEMQNWLNTNYLYFVPEFVDPIDFEYSSNKPIVEYIEAKALNIDTRSVILGPMSYLMMGKSKEPDIQPLDLLDEILPVYNELFLNYKRIGVKNIQIDEPMIGVDLNHGLQALFTKCYLKLREFAGSDLNLNLVSYNADIHENFDFITTLPVESIHIDMHYNNAFISEYVNKLSDDKSLSIGIVDARNVWINDLSKSIKIVSNACDVLGSDRVIIANSAPLFNCPYSVKLETDLDVNLKNELSFAVEKLNELNIIKTAINKGIDAVKEEIEKNRRIIQDETKRVSVSFQDTLQKPSNISSKTHNSDKWKAFAKKHNFPAIPTMIAGELNESSFVDDGKSQETAIELQESVGLNVISGSWLQKSYDISKFDGHVKGAVKLKKNVIPRFGNDYYNPTLVYDYPSFEENIVLDYAKKLKKSIKQKPIKLAISGASNYYYMAYVNPYLNQDEVRQLIQVGIKNNIANITDYVDIVQINEFGFINSLSLQNSKNLMQIKTFSQELNKFITELNITNLIAIYTGYINLNEYIENICHVNTDILFIESANSQHELLPSFVSYKPLLCIGFGLFDTFDSRVATKSEAILGCRKALMYFDVDQIIAIPDGDFYMKEDRKTIFKSLTAMIGAINNFRKAELIDTNHLFKSEKNKEKDARRQKVEKERKEAVEKRKMERQRKKQQKEQRKQNNTQTSN